MFNVEFWQQTFRAGWGFFFSHAAALLEEVGPNIEFGGPGGDQAACPKPGGFFFADTGIEVTFEEGCDHLARDKKRTLGGHTWSEKMYQPRMSLRCVEHLVSQARLSNVLRVQTSSWRRDPCFLAMAPHLTNA